MKNLQNLSSSAVEAKHSEVLKDSQATISCVVTGLTKQLDAVAWQKSDGNTIIVGEGAIDYMIDVGTYNNDTDSQTTILTVSAALNRADSVYFCVITSSEHGKTEDKIAVNLNVFSKYVVKE